VAERQLAQLEASTSLSSLRAPHGNKLEALLGTRAGQDRTGQDRTAQHSIRINNQWRVCFTWSGQGLADVEIVDYH
jgi:toxin HigB-1